MTTDNPSKDAKYLGELICSLRGLANFEHDDHSVGNEAADEIARLTRELEEARETINLLAQEDETATF